MNLQVDETGPVERRLRIEVPTAEVDAAFAHVYRELARHSRIPGFRPGHAPRDVLRRHFGERARGEVLERLVHESFPRAVKQADLALVGEPRLQPDAEPREGGPFAYEATVEIRPAIELKKVRGLEVARPRLPTPEQDPVEAYLEQLRGSHAQLVEVPEGSPAARGHVAVIDYEGTIGGRPFEGSSGHEQTLELGAGRAIAGFEAEIEGMAAGEQREFDLVLPQGHPTAELAGATAHFRVKLVELKRKELPALDDEFAKDVSKLDTLEALRAELRARVEASRQADERRLQAEAVVSALLEANPFPAPRGLVERRLAARIATAASELRGRIPEPELERLVEAWRTEWRAEAEREVRLAFLVPEIARVEAIEVPEEDLNARLREIAAQRGESLGRVRRSYRERGLLDALRAGMLEQRVVEFALSQANLSST